MNYKTVMALHKVANAMDGWQRQLDSWRSIWNRQKNQNNPAPTQSAKTPSQPATQPVQPPVTNDTEEWSVFPPGHPMHGEDTMYVN